MKYIIKSLLIIIATALLTACVNQNTSSLSIEPTKTISEVGKKFDYQTGKCLIDDALVSFNTLNRDDIVSIVDEDEDFYYIDCYGLVLSVKKAYIRKDSEAPFEEYNVYTKKGAVMYSDLDFTNKMNSFSLNNVVKVIDSFMGVLLVEYEGQIGYMYPSQTSKTKISTYTPKATTPSTTTNNDSGSSSSSSSSSGSSGGSNTPAPTNGDGEDITLALKNEEYITVLLGNETIEKGKVLPNDTPIYITRLNRGDVVYVLENNDNILTILISGHKATLNKKYVRMDDEEAFATFEVFTQKGAIVYSDYSLKKALKSFKLNEKVEVIDECEDRYVVKLEDGTIGYMKKANTSKTQIKVNTYSKPNTDSNSSNNGSSSNNNGGSSSSGGSSSPSSSESEWTDPIL